MLDTNQLRQQILPMLETAGLIMQEADPSDKRKMLIYPTALLTISPAQRNSENEGGVNTSEENNSVTRGGVTIADNTNGILANTLEAVKEVFGDDK